MAAENKKECVSRSALLFNASLKQIFMMIKSLATDFFFKLVSQMINVQVAAFAAKM